MTDSIIKPEHLLGKSQSLLFPKSTNHFLHKDVVKDFSNLEQAAIKSGFTLSIASSFRSYDRQLTIWNEKAEGKRDLLDSHGEKLDVEKLSSLETLSAILRWSAIPGFSRHHWGTDIDIYDASALPHEDYKIQLTPFECEEHFSSMHKWLDRNLKRFNFYRPYETDLGFVSPEKWHISHRSISKQFIKKLNLDFFINEVRNSEVLLKKLILKQSEQIYTHYVLNQE